MWSLLSSLFILLLTSTAYAAPSVSSVNDSTLVADQQLTISGTSFSSKPTAAPLIWDNFEGGSNGDALTTTSWTQYSGSGSVDGGTFSNTRAYSGSLSAYNNPYDSGGGDQKQFNTSYQTFTASDEIYYSYYIYHDLSGTLGGVMKQGRITAGSSSSPNFYGSPNMHSQLQPSASWGYTLYDNGNTFVQQTTGNISEDGWRKIELYNKLSTAGSSNGEIFMRLNNVTKWEDASAETRATGETFKWSSILLGMMATNIPSSGDYKIYIDDVYVDNTIARVEIGNASTYASCSILEPQPAFSWTTTDIGVTVNQGALGNNSDAWIYVTDTSGSVNTSGYAVSFGAGSNPPNISSLSSISINSGESITITGTDFEASQGSGKVEIGDASTYGGSSTITEQTVDSWSDTSIDFTVVETGFNNGDTAYVYVTNNSDSRTDGFFINFSGVLVTEPFTYIKDKNLLLRGDNLLVINGFDSGDE